MRLHMRSYGRGKPVVILHGLFGSLENWHTISRQLADSFLVVAMDQRNHGHSPHDEKMDYRLMAEDVVETLANSGTSSPAVVLGHSMGGKTAMQLALQFPDKVE